MKKIYQISFTILVLIVASFNGMAQNSFFSDVSEKSIVTGNAARVIVPLKSRPVSMNNQAMKNFLWALPSEQNLASRNQAPVMEIPMPDGRNARFRVWESSIQEPALQAKFPEIRTFSGQGIDDPYATIRFDYTPRGFHAQVLTTGGTYYIDPYALGVVDNYISYFRKDLGPKGGSFTCDVQDSPAPSSNIVAAACRGTDMRTYRLAVACTGEYAQAPGIAAGASASILHAAIVTTVNRVVGVYEKENALRLVLVANNNIIEYLNAATDPFNGNNNANVLINESQVVCDANIGSANYDIGHTFSTGGGGLAQLNSPCGSSKARGITGSPSPTGDAYDIDYVAHEMGHQFGGPHTFNSNACASAGGSYEPGGGTTIMAYAGICSAAENIQPNSDPIYHGSSADFISNFLVGAGSGCGVSTPTGNTLPVITSMSNNGTFIPINTPFTLTGTATDADGDAISYNWEGYDIGPAGTWPSAATSTTRPLFRTRVSKTSGSRTFPDPRVIAANYPGVAAPSAMDGLRGEVLPQVARTMKFKLTVRDNRAGGGGVVSAGTGGCQPGSTPFEITVSGTTPFALTAPNGAETWGTGSTQTVTWNNAGTDVAPFNVANVRITLSTDGGLTFPTELLASTPNDGTQTVTVPGSPSTTCRIRVEALGNIFFDISNANFTISGAVSPTFTFNATTPASVTCGTATAAVTLGTSASGGFSTPINLVATGNPAGTTVTYSVNPVTPGNSTVVTLNNMGTLAPGTYNVTITGTAGAEVKTTTLQYIVTAGSGPAITVQPTNQPACAGANATFSVTSPTATGYQWQVSTNSGGTWTNVPSAGNAATYVVTGVTTAMSGYQYRVIVTGVCGTTTSAVATLTVNTAPAITTQPVAGSICATFNTSFTVAATGTNLTYQWQSSTDGGTTWTNIANGGVYSGATTNTLTITAATAAMNNTCYRAVVSGTCSPAATSSSACLTVVVPASITNQPANASICSGGTITFTVGGANVTVYEWQESTNGGTTWTTLTNTAPYSGVNTATLTITNVPAGFASPARSYRALLSNANCTVKIPSNAATLTITARPTAVLSASPSNQIYPGQTTTLTATITNGSPSTIITWFRNGVVVPGVTTNSYVVDVDHLGAYQVRVSDPTGTCFSVSNIDTVSAAPNNRLFITPNPNRGQFQVRYYSNAINFGFHRTVTIYDSKGAKVYTQPLTVTGAYGPLNVDIRKSGKGIYFVVLGDYRGKVMAKGKVIVE